MATESQPSETPSKKPNLASFLVPVAAILAICLFVIGYLGEHHSDGKVLPADGMIAKNVGSVIPDLELESLDGKKTKLSELKSKVIVLNFWATWCPPCVKEMPSLQKLSEAYKGKGLSVVGVSLDENPGEVLEPFLKKHGIQFSTFVDPTGVLADRFSVSGLPLTLVIDENRKVLHQQVGDEVWDGPEFRKQFDLWLSQADSG